MHHKFYISILLMVAVCSAAFAQSYPYLRELKPDSAGGWHTAILPAELIGKTNYNFSDLRIKAISDNNDTLDAPYMIRKLNANPSAVTLPFKVLNQARYNNRFYYTFMPLEKSAIQSITLDFSLENFDWMIQLEGSHNQQEWFTLVNDYRIVSIKNQLTDYKFTQLAFEPSNYSYYRLAIPSATDPGFKSANLLMPSKDSTKYYEYPVLKPSGTIAGKQKETIWLIDLPQLLPISQVQLFCSGQAAFVRPVEVYLLDQNISKDSAKSRNYFSVGRFTLSSFQKEPYKFNPNVTQQIKIVVTNYDNEPVILDSLKVTAPQRSLITRLPAAHRYIIVYGIPGATEPLYDIESILNYNTPITMKNAVIGAEQFIGAPAKALLKPWWENAMLLYSLLGAIILIMGIFTLQIIRKKERDL
jgi:hypothetical protein